MSNKLDIEILYEDADIVAINKPANLMVHTDGRSGGPFLTDWITATYPEAADVGDHAHDTKGEKIERSGIVHRLDRETSGVLLIAKTQIGFETLKQQFKDRTIKKKYLAYIWGDLKEEFGTIDRPIGRSQSDFRKWSAQRSARGELRKAETYWTKVGSKVCEVIVTDGSKTHGDNIGRQHFTLVEVEPKTGRTHQIRVHFAAIQHPVVGDRLYAPKKPMALGFERTALHSVSIQFVNVSGKSVTVKATLPPDFVAAGNM